MIAETNIRLTYDGKSNQIIYFYVLLCNIIKVSKQSISISAKIRVPHGYFKVYFTQKHFCLWLLNMMT